jgi:hypothetical protein
MYNIIKEQEDQLREKRDGIKEDIATLMHEDKTNDITIDVDGIAFRVFYQGRTSKRTDYKVLYEIVGPQKYGEIVTENQSSFLSVRKAKKGDQSGLTHKAPNGNNKKLIPPAGTLA